MAYFNDSVIRNVEVGGNLKDLGSAHIYEKDGKIYIGKLDTSMSNNVFFGFVLSYSHNAPSFGSLEINAFAGDLDAGSEYQSSQRISTLSFSCFKQGTLITLSNGKKVPVEDLSYEDNLLVWNFDEGKYDTAKPLWLKKPEKAHFYYHCIFENGLTLDLIGSNGNCHRLFNCETQSFEWANTCVGSNVYTSLGVSKLLSCEKIDEECVFYNLNTFYHINCFANDVLTSCRYNNIYPIKDMKFEKDGRGVVPFSEYEQNGIPTLWYDGMRLGEQIIPTQETVTYCLERIKNIK